MNGHVWLSIQLTALACVSEAPAKPRKLNAS
jgi:hypothetical protein